MSGRGKAKAPKVAKLEAPQPAVARPRAAKLAVAKPPAALQKPAIPLDPLSENEGLQVVFVWVTSTSPFFHRLAKVVIREMCTYLGQETTQVYAIEPGYLYVYDLRTEQGHQLFISKPDLVLPLYMRSVRIDRSRVFCCGGERKFHIEWVSYGKRTYCDDACVVNFDGSGQKVSPMLKARSGHGLTVFQRRVFVFGGGKPDYIGKSRGPVACECFNFESGKWCKLPNLHFARESCSVCKLGDRAYLYGSVPKVEVCWLRTRTLTVAEFRLPTTDITATVKQKNQLLLITPTRQFCVRNEEQKATLEVTEDGPKSLYGSFSVYWQGRIYSDGNSSIQWINASDYSESGGIYSLEGLVDYDNSLY